MKFKGIHADTQKYYVENCWKIGENVFAEYVELTEYNFLWNRVASLKTSS
jgi:hypothetical protein